MASVVITANEAYALALDARKAKLMDLYVSLHRTARLASTTTGHVTVTVGVTRKSNVPGLQVKVEA